METGLMPPIRRIEVDWLVENNRDIEVGPEGRTILQLRARKETQLLHFHLNFPEAPDGLEVEVVVGYQEPAYGVRALNLQHLGKLQRVTARQDFAGTIALAILHEKFMHRRKTPEDKGHWWTWAGQLSHLILSPGTAVGLVARSNMPTRCRGKVGGR